MVDKLKIVGWVEERNPTQLGAVEFNYRYIQLGHYAIPVNSLNP